MNAAINIAAGHPTASPAHFMREEATGQPGR